MEKMELVKRLTELKEDNMKSPRSVIPDKFRIRSPGKKKSSNNLHSRSSSTLQGPGNAVRRAPWNPARSTSDATSANRSG